MGPTLYASFGFACCFLSDCWKEQPLVLGLEIVGSMLANLQTR